MKVKAREADKVGGEANVGDVHNEGELNPLETKTTMKKRDIIVKITNVTVVARLATLLGIVGSSKRKGMQLPLREVEMKVKKIGIFRYRSRSKNLKNLQQHALLMLMPDSKEIEEKLQERMVEQAETAPRKEENEDLAAE
ncbi:hypothetical protein COLO4_16861 [Corchorus olitorius]|uniref:Uncharacterized protein n=1 Tax=Corchorus olitorius TaxID=93759 RepID=A0A1R3JF51_9ROSI|nr:hypothetical protein COLO4_16861 [Corchorus olitorius]